VTEELKPLSEPFGLRTRITTRIGERGSRVQ
jgi:hypothetical protein